MEVRELLDKLYQMWSQTTGSEDTYWDYQPGDDGFTLNSVGKDGPQGVVAVCGSDEDADWITAVHGAFGDLMRRFHEALDEADRADESRDDREKRIAELEMEVASLRKEVKTA